MEIAIILAGGRGSRMNSDVPKQYMDVNGRPLLYYTIQAFQNSFIDEIVLVCGENDISYVSDDIVRSFNFDKVKIVTAGGKERYNSVYNGLRAVYDKYKDSDINIYIHDGARPCVDAGILLRCREDVQKYNACVAAVPVKDTIKISDKEQFAVSTPDRRTLWQIQTPQAFSFGLAWKAYSDLMESQECDGITDDAMVIEHFTNAKVHLTEGSYCNIKVTTPEDIEIIKIFLNKI